MKKRGYFENLDGLRFLCFLSVFLYHSFATDFAGLRAEPLYVFVKHGLVSNGNLGVNFFFVLSGFLITYLLIEEKETNGKINIRNFWIRRILRIWPLFYACVLFGFYGFPVLKTAFGQVPNETAHLKYYLLFLNNFDFIKNGLPDASVLGVLWSVAIEEQFYLIWPLILFALPVKRYWMAFAGVIASSLIFRAGHDIDLLNEHHTLSCIGDMAVGAFGAWAILKSNKLEPIFRNLKKWQILPIYLAFIAIFFFRIELLQGTHILRVFERLIIALVILAIILEQNYSEHSFIKMSRFKRITNLGKITYGLYCLHFIGILITTTLTRKLGWNTHLWQVLFLETGVALGITILISQLSFNYFEKPFLKIKERFSPLNKAKAKEAKVVFAVAPQTETRKEAEKLV